MGTDRAPDPHPVPHKELCIPDLRLRYHRQRLGIERCQPCNSLLNMMHKVFITSAIARVGSIWAAVLDSFARNSC